MTVPVQSRPSLLSATPHNTVVQSIASVSWGRDRIDLFWVGADRSLQHRWWDGRTWSSDESLGGDLAAAPTVTSWAANEMEVFAVFGDGQLHNLYWDGVDVARLARDGRRPHRPADRVQLRPGSDRRVRHRTRRRPVAHLVERHRMGAVAARGVTELAEQALRTPMNGRAPGVPVGQIRLPSGLDRRRLRHPVHIDRRIGAGCVGA